MAITSQELKTEYDRLFVQLTPDGKYGAILESNRWGREELLRLFELSNLPTLKPVEMDTHRGQYTTDEACIAISPNRRYIVLPYYELDLYDNAYPNCRIWDTKKQEFLPEFMRNRLNYASSYQVMTYGGGLHRGLYEYCEFLEDQDQIVTVTYIGDILIWSVSEQRLLWAVGASSHRLHGFALSHKIGKFATSEELHGYLGKREVYGNIGMYTTLGDRLFFHNVGEAHFWDHSRAVGRYGRSEKLASGNYLRLWNIHSGELLQEFETDAKIENLTLSHDDSLLVGNEQQGQNAKSYIWDVATGTKLQSLPRSTKPIGFTSDDRYLVVQNGDNRIKLWDVVNQAWFDSHEVDGFIMSAQLTDTDKVVVLAKVGDDKPTWWIHQIQFGE